jgi:hypothetical protein
MPRFPTRSLDKTPSGADPVESELSQVPDEALESGNEDE